MRKSKEEPPEDPTSDLVKFKRLAQRVLAVKKSDLDPETKLHKERKLPITKRTGRIPPISDH